MSATARGTGALLLVSLVAALMSGCTTLPSSSTPEAIRTLSRPQPDQAVQPPTPGAAPDALLREFIAASTSPQAKHGAARQYLSREASARWDDGAGVSIVDNIVMQQVGPSSDTHVTFRVNGTRVGRLLDEGVYEPDTGTLNGFEIGFVRFGGEWRIDRLPQGVILDRLAFRNAYRPYPIYFLNPAETQLVPDLRWIANEPGGPARQLIRVLAGAPRGVLAPAVKDELAGGISVIGVSRGDGRGEPARRGLGGIRIDLHGAGALDRHNRELLAAQIIWTLADGDIQGPYILQSDGKPLDDRFPDDWPKDNVAALNPHVLPGEANAAPLVVSGGVLATVANTGLTRVSGTLGSPPSPLQQATLSFDRKAVAAVADSSRAGPASPPRELLVGGNGGSAASVARGVTIAKPTWFPDNDSVWTVVDGARVIRVAHDLSAGQTSVADVDATAINAVGHQITALRLSRDGVRAAVIVDDRVYIAMVVMRSNGKYALTSPRPTPIKPGGRASSIAWSSGSELLVAQDGTDSPLIKVSIDGAIIDTSVEVGNLTLPVKSVDVTPTMDYIQDSRTILQLKTNGPQRDDFWHEVPNLSGMQATPVLPG